jgi:hypothetical protein
MPVIYAGNFGAKLQEWARQPDLGLQGYELLPFGVQLSSIEVSQSGFASSFTE